MINQRNTQDLKLLFVKSMNNVKVEARWESHFLCLSELLTAW